MKNEYEICKKRREQLQNVMEDDSVAFFFSPPAALKSNDVHYPFRTDSDLYYLTGFPEEEVILVLYKDKNILYLRKRDPDMETWNGKRLGIENACETLGVNEARDTESFKKDLPELLKNKKIIYHHYGRNSKIDSLLLETNANLIRRSRMSEFGPDKIIHLSGVINEMRLLKDSQEINFMRECARITHEAHVEAMKMVRPGLYEYELEAKILHIFKKYGGDFAYPSIVAAGNNACILHYVENNSMIKSDDLILIDAGAEKDYLNADVTRTFPASGRFNPAQKNLYEIVLASQKTAISLMTRNNTLDQVHNETVKILTEGLIDLGILKGSLDENLENQTYKKFYMHKTGHWLGRDVHDVGRYYDGSNSRPLKDGMVATVEPGLYIDENTQDIPLEFCGIGIRIEDDVLVNGTSPDVITDSIPKEIAEIESLILEFSKS